MQYELLKMKKALTLSFPMFPFDLPENIGKEMVNTEKDNDTQRLI